MNDDESLLKVKEAAGYLRLSPGTVYHMVSQRRLPCVRFSARCLRFRKSELENFIKKKSVPGK